jgi:hypothetical protein
MNATRQGTEKNRKEIDEPDIDTLAQTVMIAQRQF